MVLRYNMMNETEREWTVCCEIIPVGVLSR